MIHELDCYTNIKTEIVSNLDQKYPVKKTEMYQTSVRGGGGGNPHLVKKKKLFSFFSFEGFPQGVGVTLNGVIEDLSNPERYGLASQTLHIKDKTISFQVIGYEQKMTDNYQ